MTKIGLAVITYKRPEFLIQCLESLEKNSWGGANERIVVIDEPFNNSYSSVLSNIKVEVFDGPNGGVAVAKNRALAELYNRGCDHIFLMEDDILMQDPQTCLKYIDYAAQNKIQHMNFAYHGPQLNRTWYMEYDGIHCQADCVGAFSYYTREVIDVIGFMDDNFYNAWEHVEHTMRISQLGYTTPFWFFADHPESKKMLKEIPGSIENSSIRPDPKWTEKMRKGRDYWISKWGAWLPPRPDYFGGTIPGLRVKSFQQEKDK